MSNQRKEVVHSFRSYGGHSLTAFGCFEAIIGKKYESVTTDFIVVKDYGKVLIGYKTGIPLRVMKIGECVNRIEQKNQMNKIKGTPLCGTPFFRFDAYCQTSLFILVEFHVIFVF